MKAQAWMVVPIYLDFFEAKVSKCWDIPRHISKGKGQ